MRNEKWENNPIGPNRAEPLQRATKLQFVPHMFGISFAAHETSDWMISLGRTALAQPATEGYYIQPFVDTLPDMPPPSHANTPLMPLICPDAASYSSWYVSWYDPC